MNDDYEESHTRRLLRHARDAAAALQGHDMVSGAIVAGSPSHGGADRESDVDLLVIVKRLPDCVTRAGWLSAIMGETVEAESLAETEGRRWDEFQGPKDDPEQWMGTGGALLYFTEEEIESDLGRVEELLTGRDEGKGPGHLGEHLADVAHGIVLCDSRGFVAKCQRRLADYPETARVQLINSHWRRAEIAIHEDLQRAVWRGDWVHAYDRRVEGSRHLIRMLFAMNRRYFRKAKSLHRLFPQFDACPTRAWERLAQGLREPDPMKGAATLMALAGETIQLVDPPDVLERREHWLQICDGWTRNHLPRTRQ